MKGGRAIAEALDRVFESPNETAANHLDPANLVDTTAEIARGLHRIADALDRAVPGADE